MLKNIIPVVFFSTDAPRLTDVLEDVCAARRRPGSANRPYRAWIHVALTRSDSAPTRAPQTDSCGNQE